MSYCRWSTDNFRCDLYCYEDVSGGWTTHVAGSRYVDGPPPVDWLLITTNFEEFSRQYSIQQWWFDNRKKLEYIGLPHDGEMFRDYSLETFRDRLVMLREAGYRFPDYVIETVDEEIAAKITPPAEG